MPVIVNIVHHLSCMQCTTHLVLALASLTHENHPIMMTTIPDTLCDSPQMPLTTASPVSSPPPHDSPHSSALALDQALKQLRHYKEASQQLKRHQWSHTKDRQRLRALQQKSASLQTLLADLADQLDQKMWARRTLIQTSDPARHGSPNLHRDSRADGLHLTANHPMQVSCDIMPPQRSLLVDTASDSSGLRAQPRKRLRSHLLYDSGDSDWSDFPMVQWSDSESESCSSNHLPHNQQLAAASEPVVSGASSPTPIGADVPSASRRLDPDDSSDVYSTPQESLWNELEQPEWNDPAESGCALPDSSSGPTGPMVVDLSKFLSHAAFETPVTGLLLETPGEVQPPKPTVDTTDAPGRVTTQSQGVSSRSTSEIKDAKAGGDGIESGKYRVEPVMVDTTHGVGEWLKMEHLIFHSDSIFAKSILRFRGIEVRDLRAEVSIDCTLGFPTTRSLSSVRVTSPFFLFSFSFYQCRAFYRLFHTDFAFPQSFGAQEAFHSCLKC